jgi:hypothetical protein
VSAAVLEDRFAHRGIMLQILAERFADGALIATLF